MNLFQNLPPASEFKHFYVRPGDHPWPDTAAHPYALLTLIAGGAPPLAYDQAKLLPEIARCAGVFVAIDEPGWRWTMRAVYKVMSEAALPALVVIVECSAESDLLWLHFIAKRSRCLGRTDAVPLPALHHQLN